MHLVIKLHLGANEVEILFFTSLLPNYFTHFQNINFSLNPLLETLQKSLTYTDNDKIQASPSRGEVSP